MWTYKPKNSLSSSTCFLSLYGVSPQQIVTLCKTGRSRRVNNLLRKACGLSEELRSKGNEGKGESRDSLAAEIRTFSKYGCDFILIGCLCLKMSSYKREFFPKRLARRVQPPADEALKENGMSLEFAAGAGL
jgi:hypothetical protein